jgi:hypothetical protein
MAFKFTEGPDGNFKFEGKIYENSHFPSLGSIQSDVVIDLEGCKYINSSGVKEWIKWIRAYEGLSFKFQNMPATMVLQANTVADFLPKTYLIESFYVPYFCEDDESRVDIKFVYGKEYKKSVDVDDLLQLKRNGQQLEMDVSPKVFFKFLQGMSTAE